MPSPAKKVFFSDNQSLFQGLAMFPKKVSKIKKKIKRDWA